MTDSTAYPQHDRLDTFAAERNAASDFLDFLGEQGFVICRPATEFLGWGETVAPAPLSDKEKGDLIGRWLGIDPAAFEAEKVAALAAARAASREAGPA